MILTTKSEKVSIICGCMNRSEPLVRSLDSWRSLSEPDEILIVDWNSTVPLVETLSPFLDPRIKIIRVINQKHWVLSKCYNLAIHMASNEVLLKLDSDYLIFPEFFKKHSLTNNNYYSGYWSETIGNKSQLCGCLYIHKNNLIKVGKYNEGILNYGYEDLDLYNRLDNLPLTHLKIDYDTCDHIPHGGNSRTVNQPIDDLEKSNLQNMKIASWNKWSSVSKTTKWKIVSQSSYITTVEAIFDDKLKR